jgi:lipoprotein signal peptidase
MTARAWQSAAGDRTGGSRYLDVTCMLWSRDVSCDSRHPRPLARPPAANDAVRTSAARAPARPVGSVLVFALIALVVVIDQSTKWWAWRHVPWSKINPGGDILVGQTIGSWYAAPATGALLDVLDFALLSAAVWALARYRIPAFVTVPGALMVGGWGSNLLDRLGTHYWNAPGSVRGAVDFIYLGDRYYNLADFFIIGCTPLFVLAAGWYAVLAVRQPAVTARPLRARTWPTSRPTARSRARLRARLRAAAVAGAGLILVVVLGATHDGGVSAAVVQPSGTTGQQAAWQP